MLLFDLFNSKKKSAKIELMSVISGELQDISKVPDPVFAGEVIGPGFTIDPEDNKIFAPVDAVVKQVAKDKHAVTLEANNGAQILIHIGVDTVNLKGKGFINNLKIEQKVKAGDLLIVFDMNYIKANAPSKKIVVILLNQEKYHLDLSLVVFNRKITAKESLNIFIQKRARSKKEIASVESKDSYQKSILIKHKTGIHARPAALIQNKAKEYAGEITLTFKDKSASAKSILDILNLGISYQDEVLISANGDHCRDVVNEIYAMIESSATDEDESDNKMEKKATIKVDKSNKTMNPNLIFGTTVCEGIAVGEIKHLTMKMPDFEGTFSNIDDEKQQFYVASKSVEHNIQQNIDLETNENNINIQKAHINLLNDDLWTRSVIKNIEANHSVAKAIKLALKEISDNLNKVDNEVIRQRVNDIRDIAMQLLLVLTPESHQTNDVCLLAPAVIVAEDILPSVFSNLDKNNILAIVTTQGSLTTHISIMACSYAIPMLVLVDDNILKVPNKQLVVVDTLSSNINIKPTDEQIQQANDLRVSLENQTKEINQFSKQPALTTDGIHIKVFANITNDEEAKKAFEIGADGIGLLRSEMLFMHKKSMPDDKQQQQDYQKIIDSMNGLAVTIRTLDIGTDKGLDYYPLDKEQNPVLGIRGIRVSLQDDELLYTQLRAILSIEPITAYKIMLPMISRIDEVVKVKKVIDEISTELKLSNKPQLGVMIETPSAALLVPQLNKYVDFYSIGTNDLSQYVLAMDRNSTKLLKYIDGLHPAVIRMIKIATQAATIENKPVAVCGMLAEDVNAVPILLGVGVGELSVSPVNVGKIKDLVRKLNIEKCHDIADQCIKMDGAENVRVQLNEFLTGLDKQI